MKWMLVGCSLLLAGCETADLTAGGRSVQTVQGVPAGCRMVGTVRDSEGGGLQSLEYNRSLIEARMRNRAAYVGGDSIAVVEEHHGDADDYNILFPTGASGLTTPSAPCSNCVALTAHIFQCKAHPAPAVVPAPQRDDCTPSAPPNGQPDDEDWNACLKRHGLPRNSASR